MRRLIFSLSIVFSGLALTGMASAWEIPYRDRDIQMDGQIAEWSDAPALVLAPDQAGLRTAGEFEEGDLSLNLKAFWDDQHLYLCLEWTDNVWDLKEIERQDAVWIGADGKRRDRMQFFDYLKVHIRQADYDYTLWLSPRVDGEGPYMWFRLLEGYRGIESATRMPLVASSHSGHTVTMEVQLTWDSLKLNPRKIEGLPLTILLTDGDAPGRFLDSKLESLKWIAWRGTVRFVPGR